MVLLDPLKEPAVVTFQKRHAGGKIYGRDQYRGRRKLWVKAAERAARRRSSPRRGMGHAGLGLVSVLVFALAAAWLVPARAESQSPAMSPCLPNGAAMSRVELYFGMARTPANQQQRLGPLRRRRRNRRL
jgi:hypothetical protein